MLKKTGLLPRLVEILKKCDTRIPFFMRYDQQINRVVNVFLAVKSTEYCPKKLCGLLDCLRVILGVIGQSVLFVENCQYYLYWYFVNRWDAYCREVLVKMRFVPKFVSLFLERFVIQLCNTWLYVFEICFMHFLLLCATANMNFDANLLLRCAFDDRAN